MKKFKASYLLIVLIGFVMVYCAPPEGSATDSEEITGMEQNSEDKEYFKTKPGEKPLPDQVLDIFKDGNERFASGTSAYPNTKDERIAQAATSNQGNYALATVISCSDSRVPVEILFDAGIMDIFVIRVAGNVCDTDEVGSIEYGLAHVNTPLMIVLGHSQCGAVTAVTHAVEGHGHQLERNIPPLVDNIIPAVKRAKEENPDVDEEGLIPLAIEENVWQSTKDLFIKSPATRNLVKEGKVKVVGAIYDLSTGKVNWLDESKPGEILSMVEQMEDIPQNAMAE